MKLKNIFKKSSVKSVASQKVLSKDQLVKVVGGTDPGETETDPMAIEKKRTYSVGQPHYGN